MEASFSWPKYRKRCEMNIYVKCRHLSANPLQKLTCEQNSLYIMCNPFIGQRLLKSKSNYENKFQLVLEAAFLIPWKVC